MAMAQRQNFPDVPLDASLYALSPEGESDSISITDELPLLVWMHDADGEPRFANRAFCEYFGVSREQVASGSWSMALHADDRRTYRDEFLACVRGARSFHAEVRVQRADGRWRWIESWGRPRFSPTGAYLGHVGASVDVSERKHAEEDSRRRQSELELQDDRKAIFLATLGHELRNPLAALDGAVRLLGTEEGDRPRLQRRMEAHVEQLTALVDDLLDITRIERGKVALRKAPADFAAIVRGSVATVRGRFVEKRQELKLTLPSNLTLDADARRLEQVVSNLLTNATKYTPEGGRIELKLRREGSEAVLSVRDEGRGLEPEQLERIFEPFMQDDASVGGLGIGLPLVRGLVALHGGTVRASSDGLWRGSNFVVRLPIVAGERGERESQSELAAECASARRRSARLQRAARILVVDDMRDAADTLALLLRRAGADARCAYTGAEGVHQAASWKPEVALIDIGLPDTSGYEVADAIRSSASDPVLLVAVTGFSDPNTEQRLRTSAFTDKLLKPVDLERLLEIVNGHLQRPPRA